MAVKYINPNEKIESGFIVSGEDADKVFSLIFDKKEEEIKKSKEKQKKLFEKVLKTK